MGDSPKITKQEAQFALAEQTITLYADLNGLTHSEAETLELNTKQTEALAYVLGDAYGGDALDDGDMQALQQAGLGKDFLSRLRGPNGEQFALQRRTAWLGEHYFKASTSSEGDSYANKMERIDRTQLLTQSLEKLESGTNSVGRERALEGLSKLWPHTVPSEHIPLIASEADNSQNTPVARSIALQILARADTSDPDIKQVAMDGARNSDSMIKGNALVLLQKITRNTKPDDIRALALDIAQHDPESNMRADAMKILGNYSRVVVSDGEIVATDKNLPELYQLAIDTATEAVQNNNVRLAWGAAEIFYTILRENRTDTINSAVQGLKDKFPENEQLKRLLADYRTPR